MRVPTRPLLLPIPFGNLSDREFNKIRTDSKADAARTTNGARKDATAPLVVHTVVTPVTALAAPSVVNAATVLFGKRLSLPVTKAALSIGDKGAGWYPAT